MTRSWTEVKVPQALFRLLMMLAVALLLNTGRARAAAEIEMSGGGDCTDPIFSSFTANVFNAGVGGVGVVGGGGGCMAFPNFGGGGASGIQITTAFTHADTFFCSGGDLFADCGFSIDGGLHLLASGSTIGGPGIPDPTTLTILFFGGAGIPGGEGGLFTVNLNHLVPCSPTFSTTDSRLCQNPSEAGAGGWGDGHTFEGAAVPEPNVQIGLLFCGAATVIGRALAARRRRNSQSRVPEIS